MLLAQGFWETNYVFPLYSCCTWRTTVFCQSPTDCCKSAPYQQLLWQPDQKALRLKESICKAAGEESPPTFSHEVVTWWESWTPVPKATPISKGNGSAACLLVPPAYTLPLCRHTCCSTFWQPPLPFWPTDRWSFIPGLGGARMLSCSRLGMWLRVTFAGSSRVGSWRKASLAELLQLFVLSHSFVASGRAGSCSWWCRCTEASWSCYAKPRTILPAFRPNTANCHQQISHAFL